MRITLLLLFFSSVIFAQDTISLQNPSFEGDPRLSFTPPAWYDCGFPGESQVDLHPVPASEFQVDKEALDGETYLGMVTRENDTWEAVGQQLKKPLLGGRIYEFSIHLARSATYLSKVTSQNNRNKTSEAARNKINFATPIKLRIWGGNGYCGKQELLAESSLAINTRWLKYDLIFQPKGDYRYITFEAFYQSPTPYPYNGNILLDNCSPIIEIAEDELFVRDTSIVGETSIDNNVIKKALVKRKKPLSTDDKVFYEEQMSYLIFRRGMTSLEAESVIALKAIIEKLSTSEEDYNLKINLKGDNSLLLNPRRSSIRAILEEAKFPESRYGFGKKPEKGTLSEGGSRDVELFIY